MDFIFRTVAPRALAAGAAVTASLAAMAAGPTEGGVSRAGGGVYTNIPATDAAACAIACAQDKICLAWSFTATEYVGCALRAIVPPVTPDAPVTSGVADRASAFLALTSLSKPPQPAAEEPAERFSAPATDFAAIIPFERAGAPAPLTAHAAAPVSDPPAIAEPELLGGPSAQQFTMAPALVRVSVTPLAEQTIVAWRDAPVIEMFEPGDLQGAFALAAPLGRAEASPLAALASWQMQDAAELIDPTIEMNALFFAAAVPLARKDADFLPAARDFQAAQAAELIDPTIAPPAELFAAAAPLANADAPALWAALDIETAQIAALSDPAIAAPDQSVFAEAPPPSAVLAPPAAAEPATQVASSEPAGAHAQLALYTATKRPIPPAPSAEALLIAAQADGALEEELLGGPDASQDALTETAPATP